MRTKLFIMNKVMLVWIRLGLGVPEKFLADYGGEFANEIYKGMYENLNIQVLNIAGQSPWQNDLCERNHVAVDTSRCLEKILEDNPNTPSGLIWLWLGQLMLKTHFKCGSGRQLYK